MGVYGNQYVTYESQKGCAVDGSEEQSREYGH